MPEPADILIVGGGLVGASLAIALDAAGRSVTLIEATPPHGPSPADNDASANDRNLALARASVNALRALDVWGDAEGVSAPITRLHVSRAGEFGATRVSAREIGVEALGATVPGRALGAALGRRLQECRHLTRLMPARLEKLEPIPDSRDHGFPPHPPSAARLSPSSLGGEAARSAERAALGEGAQSDSGWRACFTTPEGAREIEARLLVGADGSDSLVRAQVGIDADAHDYAQSLFVCTIACERDLQGCAFERFSDDGPVALLPLPAGRAGLVLTVAADRHEELSALDDAGFIALAQARFGWKLGAFSRPGRRHPHRVRRVIARALTAPRAVLVGNAAQTVHPIGAQGFNLGLRDALTLAELIAETDDPGATELLHEYATRRAPDREGVLAFSHGLVSLTCLPQPVFAPLRSLALAAFDRLPTLKRAMALHGMGFRGNAPPGMILDRFP